MERMTELVQKLNEYAYRYYTLDEPIVSDKEYDALYDELVALDTTNLLSWKKVAGSYCRIPQHTGSEESC